MSLHRSSRRGPEGRRARVPEGHPAGSRTEELRPASAAASRQAQAAIGGHPVGAPLFITLDGAASLRESERYCQELARREAANFYWGFIALPREQRVAIYALYSFARQVDDDADLPVAHLGGNGSTDRFAYHRARLDNLPSPSATDPVIHVLGAVTSRYGIPRAELEALIRGVEMDLAVRRYASWEELKAYCELVASTIGRMCVRIFGYSEPVALVHATELGLALQLTNILRDVREDLALGRVYLPQEDLRSFGLTERALARDAPGAGWESLVRFESDRARELFHTGLQVTEYIPRRAAACVLTMAGIYREILREIERDPYLPLRRRIALRKRDKLGVLARSWIHAM